MSQNDLIKQLKETPMVMEEELLSAILDEVASTAAVLELHIGNARNSFNATFIPMPGGHYRKKIGPEEGLRISLPDPVSGIKLIQKFKKVRLLFYMDLFALETQVTLRGFEKFDGKPVVKLSFPKVLKSYPKRRLLRHPVLEEMGFKTTLRRQKKRLGEGVLMDLHLEGCCVMTQDETITFSEDERISVEIRSPKLLISEIPLQGRVCYSHKLRDPSSPKLSYGLHGFEFVESIDFLPALKRTVTIVADYAPEEEEVDINSLVDEIFS
ncbi:MAG: hypothetical protein HQL50_01220 [Magnetococcales bacterium]|nr:hypothetical protein [Magnetococcales bacterium]